MFKVGDLVWESFELRQVEECNDSGVYTVCYPNLPSKKHGGSRRGCGTPLRVHPVTEQTTEISQRFAKIDKVLYELFRGCAEHYNGRPSVCQWLVRQWNLILAGSTDMPSFQSHLDALVSGKAFVDIRQQLNYLPAKR